MILAACPTGTTSNLLTYLARGDVALALSFTAVASVLTIFTLPLIVTWSLGHFLGAQRAVDVPVGTMMGQVFLVLGLPVTLGMVVCYTEDPGIQSSKKFLAQGLQTAAGVPLQCDEPADFMTFRVGLFGLEKLHNADRAVAQLTAALDAM
jgi:hypothetical protein